MHLKFQRPSHTLAKGNQRLSLWLRYFVKQFSRSILFFSLSLETIFCWSLQRVWEVTRKHIYGQGNDRTKRKNKRKLDVNPSQKSKKNPVEFSISASNLFYIIPTFNVWKRERRAKDWLESLQGNLGRGSCQGKKKLYFHGGFISASCDTQRLSPNIFLFHLTSYPHPLLPHFLSIPENTFWIIKMFLNSFFHFLNAQLTKVI